MSNYKKKTDIYRLPSTRLCALQQSLTCPISVHIIYQDN